MLRNFRKFFCCSIKYIIFNIHFYNYFTHFVNNYYFNNCIIISSSIINLNYHNFGINEKIQYS